jgi:YidC/Oxa1 family membrane protein insertase
MEMKRTILAVVLSMAVLLLFQKYIAPPAPAPVPAPAPAVTEAPAAVPAPSISTAAPSGSVPASSGATAAQAEARIVMSSLENDVIRVDLTNRGGAVVGARLNRYREAPSPEAPPVALLSGASGVDLAGATRLVTLAPNWGGVYDLTESTGQRIVYEASVGNGIRVRKTYTLEPAEYDVRLEVRLMNAGTDALRDRLGTIMIQDFSAREDKYTFSGPAYFKGDDYEEIGLGKLEEGLRDSGTISWAAFLEKYFLVALVPDQADGNELRMGNYLGTENVVEMELLGPVFDLEPATEKTFAYRIYLGPKQAEVLAPLGSNLDRLLNFGFFDMIAQPLLLFLNWIYGFMGNYGVAIIILTTVIKLMFWPLSAKSYKSMQRMKELQPKMQKLKERYGDDKERLNMEVMQLYKTHKVNPLGGCLPMLVQIPFFFALYKILLGSIELRHAPFVLWITDLSAADTLFSDIAGLPFALGPLPLLMGVSMFLQQRMTPTTGGNEAQMKMMMYGMPIIFTFMFLSFPSGLVLYWLINNVLSIAQQGMMLRQAKANPAAA